MAEKKTKPDQETDTRTSFERFAFLAKRIVQAPKPKDDQRKSA